MEKFSDFIQSRGNKKCLLIKPTSGLMMQAMKCKACILSVFSTDRNLTGRHYLMLVLWNPSVSGFHFCKVFRKIY